MNVALFSRYARRVRLQLFEHPEDSTAARVIDFEPSVGTNELLRCGRFETKTWLGVRLWKERGTEKRIGDSGEGTDRSSITDIVRASQRYPIAAD